MEYYLTMQRNEVPICAATWMNFENSVLNERSHHKGWHTAQVPLYEISRKGKSIDTERLMVAEDLGQWGFGGTRAR